MSSLQLLHLAMVVLWAVTSLYLRGLTVATRPMDAGDRPRAFRARQHMRRVFLGVATPAALVTVASGQTLHPPVEQPGSLMLYLVVIGVLFWAHGAFGFLVLNPERRQYGGLVHACRFLSGLTIALLLLLTGMVLTQPG